MMQSPIENSKSRPSVVATITAGFELTTSHPWLITLPLLIDLFYWIGPRLSVSQLVEKVARGFAFDSSAVEMVNEAIRATSGYNLFSALSVPVIGLPALMRGAAPAAIPLSLGDIAVDSSEMFLGLFLLFTVLGVLFSAIYFHLIAAALGAHTSSGKSRVRRVFDLAKGSVISWIRLSMLGIFVLAILFIAMIPLLPLTYFVAMLSETLALLVLLSGLTVVLIYLSMSVPSIVIDQQPVGIAIVTSVKIVRRYLMPTLLLLFLVVLMSSGMNLLWRLADTGNWLTLASIGGHAFISTALVSSILIYYRDRSLFKKLQGK